MEVAQSFRLFQQDPTGTSSASEVRLWIEELDYSFLAYGENFERAEINGERHDRQRLNELGIIRTDHQDIILKAVANIYKKSKVEEQAMQGEDQNDKKMPTRFRKQTEHLEHAIDRVLVMISERRRVRSLHGTNEQPPAIILTAALELINMVKMILNILERPPLDCMSVFSGLKSHLIKHITLLKHFSEQSDLSHEMESDMIDVCKGVSKICHYILALPPDLPGPETQIPEFITPKERPPGVQVPISIKPEVMSFSMKHGPDYGPSPQHSLMPITTTSSSSEPVLSLQPVSLPSERVPDRLEYFSPEWLNTPSNEGAVMMRHDEGNESETEISDTKGSETPAGSLDYKSLQCLTIVESDTPLMDSGSERCMIDSDSDRGISLDSDLEYSKDSDSVIWVMDSDSEKCPSDSDSVKHLLEAENYQMVSGSAEDPMESKQHLVGVEQGQVDSDSLEYWMDSGSEKDFVDSDSEKYQMDSDNEKSGIDSDSEKCPMASASVKHLLKAEKRQMASDSIKRLIESEKCLMEMEKFWNVSGPEKYVLNSDKESGRMDSASAPAVYLKEKHQEKTRSERYMMDSDSEPCGIDSDSERYGLASANVKCLMDVKTFQLSADTEGLWMDSWSERRTIDLDSECLGMASDSVKHMMKTEKCQKASNLESSWIGLESKSERCLMDSEREELNFVCGRCWESSRKYKHRSTGLQDSSGRCQDDLQKHWDNFERHQIDSASGKHQTNSEKERHQNEFESERHLMEKEREQCLIQFENKRLQMDEERGGHLKESDNEKEHRIECDSERHHLDSENEAQRLGARKKDNRPLGFWKPIFQTSLLGQGMQTEEQHSVQQIDNKGVSRIQLLKHMSDDKIVRFKKESPTLSDKQDSKQKLKEKCSHNLSPDPNIFMDNKRHRNVTRKTSVYKNLCKDYKYAHSFQSSASPVKPVHFLSAKGYTSEVSMPVCDPTSISPRSVVRPKTHRYNTHSLDTGSQICFRCLVKINNSPFHECLINSDDDSDPDCSLHLQIPLDSKYSLSPKSVRHHKTSRNRPLSRSLDPKHPVGSRCPLRGEDSKYSLGSTSYLHCESCSALQNLLCSTVTRTLPTNPQNTMGHFGAPDPFSVINTSNGTGLESEGKFNLTFKLKNEASPDNETKPVSSNNLNDKVNTKNRTLPKDETDHEDETDSADNTDDEDETEPDDEDNTRDKKDPSDKSDPDDTDPKDSNTENDADTNSGSDPSGDAGPTGGSDSNNDGDPNNGTDSNSELDPNIDNATNNDTNSKYSTDLEEDSHTNTLDDASGLYSGVDQDSTADPSDGTNPKYISRPKNETSLDYTSGFNSGTGPSNVTGPGNDICPNIGPDRLNIRSGTNSPGPSNNGTSPNNRPSPNTNSPGSEKDPDSNYSARPSNVTSHNNAINPHNDADPNYGIRPTSAAGHNYAAAPNYDSDLNYVPGFPHEKVSSFVVNPNSVARNSYVARPSSAGSSVNATDTSKTTGSYSGAIRSRYTAGSSYALDTNHVHIFTQLIDSNFVINLNFDAINTHSAHN